MTKLQSNIREFMVKAEQVVRDKPSTIFPQEAQLRVRLVFEEAFELARALDVQVCVDNMLDVGFEKLHFQKGFIQNLIEAADAIADLNYVVNGTAVSMGIDMEPIDAEVHRSNMSKFIDGYKDPTTGKWIKGPSYSPANIKDLILLQLK